MIDYQLLFFFSALGAFNGLLLSMYFLFFAKPAHASNRFLGGLLLMLSIRIGKSVFFYFNPELSRLFLQFGLGGCFLIGPFLFFYIKSVTHPGKYPNFWKYIIPTLLIAYIIFGYFLPYQSYQILWRRYIVMSINYQWGVFVIASAFLLKDIFANIISGKKLAYHEIWVLSVFFGVSFIWLAYTTSHYTSYIVGSLSFSFVLYASVFVLFSSRNKKEITPAASKPKYANKKIEISEVKILLDRIEKLMKEEKVFKDPDLTLPRLAKQLNVTPHILSQLLNDNLKKRFSQFINEYRIEEAKKMLQSDSNLKMEVIAEQCGFNSNSTFYSAFKKFTNTTPARYMAEQI